MNDTGQQWVLESPGASETRRTPPLRVLYIQPAVAIGGAERQASLLLPALERFGVEAVAVTGPGSDIVEWFRERGVTRFHRSRHFPGKMPLKLATLPSYLRLTDALTAELDAMHRARPFEAVIGSLGFGWAAAGILGRHWGVPTIWRAGGYEISFAEELGVRFIARVVPPDLLWCNARAVAHAWSRRLSLPSRLVPNGVRLPALPRAQRRSDTLDLGYAGRLAPEKDLPTLFAAVALARRRGVPVRLFVASPGSPGDFRRLRQQAGLDPEGIHLLGKLEAMDAFYRRLDAFVLASRSEGCANVLLEAMSHGVPVLATRVGGTPELVRHDREGWLVPRGDPPSLAGAIERLWRFPALGRRAGARARRRAETFTPARSARVLASTLYQLVASKARGHSPSIDA